MPTPNQSEGGARVDFEFITPGGGYRFKENECVHQQSRIADSVLGFSVYEHYFTVSGTKFVERTLRSIMETGTPRLRFRYGYGSLAKTTWLPWQERIITVPTALLTGMATQSSYDLKLVTQDVGFYLTRGSKAASRVGTVSEIVDSIASALGVDCVCEPTVGSGTYVQSFLTDIDFIRLRLVKRAFSAKNRGNFFFYFKDNVLHFHTADYQAGVHNIDYHANASKIAFRDATQEKIDDGIAGCRVIAYDPLTGQTQVHVSNPDNSLRLSDSLTDLSQVNCYRQIMHHTGPHFQQEPAVIGQNTYENARNNALTLLLTVEKMPFIRHGDFVNLTVSTAEKASSPWSGYYYVTEAKHAINKGAVSSEYSLRRGEYTQDLKGYTISDGDRLIQENSAPGQFINVTETTSSQRTRDAGSFSVDGKIFVTVQNP